MVYFVRRGDGMIKIGYSANVSIRMSQLLNDHGPLELLAVIHGSTMSEKAHHRHFAALRFKGEWFAPGDALTSYIASLASCEDVGPIGRARKPPPPPPLYVAPRPGPPPPAGRLAMVEASSAPRWPRVYR